MEILEIGKESEERGGEQSDVQESDLFKWSAPNR